MKILYKNNMKFRNDSFIKINPMSSIRVPNSRLMNRCARQRSLSSPLFNFRSFHVKHSITLVRTQTSKLPLIRAQTSLSRKNTFPTKQWLQIKMIGIWWTIASKRYSQKFNYYEISTVQFSSKSWLTNLKKIHTISTRLFAFLYIRINQYNETLKFHNFIKKRLIKIYTKRSFIEVLWCRSTYPKL